jgi:hypothetical protein
VRERKKKIVDLTVGWISKAASVKKINKKILSDDVEHDEGITEIK